MLRSVLVAALLLGSVGVAGTLERVRIRTVVINGIQGAGYYSVVEQGYRLISPPPSVVARRRQPATGGMTVSDLDANDALDAGLTTDRLIGEETDGL